MLYSRGRCFDIRFRHSFRVPLDAVIQQQNKNKYDDNACQDNKSETNDRRYRLGTLLEIERESKAGW